MSKTFIWVSRHALNAEQQRQLMETHGFTKVVEYGDADAFSDYDMLEVLSVLDAERFRNGNDVSSVAIGCVHQRIALMAAKEGYSVFSSRNINRAPEGEKPQFQFSNWVEDKPCSK